MKRRHRRLPRVNFVKIGSQKYNLLCILYLSACPTLELGTNQNSEKTNLDFTQTHRGQHCLYRSFCFCFHILCNPAVKYNNSGIRHE